MYITNDGYSASNQQSILFYYIYSSQMRDKAYFLGPTIVYIMPIVFNHALPRSTHMQ